MHQEKKAHIIEECKNALLRHVMPFWVQHCLDREQGGIFTGVDRKGTIIETDKSIWFQGRALWVFSTIYNTVEQDSIWKEAAQLCTKFIDNYGFDEDEKMFFRVTHDGHPVIRRERYVFSEMFAIIGYAAYSKVSNEVSYREKARKILHQIYHRVESHALVSKINQETRPMQGLGYHIIMINTLQELRKYDVQHADEYTSYIMKHIESVPLFVNDSMRCVLETVGAHGEFLSNHIEGRIINPGHGIEAGWFVLQEARIQHNATLEELGLKIINYSWDWGWDTEYGGMCYFRDALNHPVSEYWHDMKFWWPQNEAVIANLMAYDSTGEEKYMQRYEEALQWAHTHFVDKEYGEWLGYLHKDGSVSSTIKGNMFKGPFHIPRMYLSCIEILSD